MTEKAFYASKNEGKAALMIVEKTARQFMSSLISDLRKGIGTQDLWHQGRAELFNTFDRNRFVNVRLKKEG